MHESERHSDATSRGLPSPRVAMLASAACAMADLAALFLPVACAGCGAEGESLCAACRGSFHTEMMRRQLSVVDGQRLIVQSGYRFDAPYDDVMRAFKNDGRRVLARAFAPGLWDAVHRAKPAGARIAVVPIPSSRAAFQRRGFRPVEILLREAGIPAVPVLAVSGQVGDQRGLGREARMTNAAGRFSLRGRLPPRSDGVILVDDVVTTGSTLRSAFATCISVGIPVLGAATVCNTPDRNMHAPSA